MKDIIEKLQHTNSFKTRKLRMKYLQQLAASDSTIYDILAVAGELTEVSNKDVLLTVIEDRKAPETLKQLTQRVEAYEQDRIVKTVVTGEGAWIINLFYNPSLVGVTGSMLREAFQFSILTYLPRAVTPTEFKVCPSCGNLNTTDNVVCPKCSRLITDYTRYRRESFFIERNTFNIPHLQKHKDFNKSVGWFFKDWLCEVKSTGIYLVLQPHTVDGKKIQYPLPFVENQKRITTLS